MMRPNMQFYVIPVQIQLVNPPEPLQVIVEEPQMILPEPKTIIPGPKTIVRKSTITRFNPPVLPESETKKYLERDSKIKVADKHTKELVKHILKKCEEESHNRRLIDSLYHTCTRLSTYTGISPKTLYRIKVTGGKVIKGDNSQKISINRCYKSVLDDRDMITIKNTIRDHYIAKRKVPSIRQMLPTIIDQIPTYYNQPKFIYLILHDIGYVRKRYYSKTPILTENSSIIAYRNNYLKTMQDLRNQNTPLIYIYECVIDKSFTFHKAWIQKYNYNTALRDTHAFIFICAASRTGFLRHKLLRQKTTLTAEKFATWVKSDLIPYLPEHSTIIMEDAPHHCALKYKPASIHATKDDIIEYLKTRGIMCHKNMRRSELYKLIECNTMKNKVYAIDDILMRHGHKAMRLPPYMVDLNPAQHAMDKIQGQLLEEEPSEDFVLNNVTKILANLMETVTASDWSSYFERVRLLERECWQKDGQFDVAVDKVLMDLQDCVESGSETSDMDSDSEGSN